MRRNFGLPSRTSHDFSSAYNGLHILGCWIVWPFFRNMSVDRMTFFPLLECRSFFFVSRYTPWPTWADFVFDFIWFAFCKTFDPRTLRKFHGQNFGSKRLLSISFQFLWNFQYGCVNWWFIQRCAAHSLRVARLHSKWWHYHTLYPLGFFL